MSGIFLTGATGFVGARVLRRLAGQDAGPLFCLARDPARLPDVGDADVRPVAGDLNRPESWTEALSQCDTVVHLAALTGKGSAAEHDRVNSDATGDLLRCAREAGARRFLFVSTIAVTYPDKRWYPYARAKEQAEERVRASEMDWAIVRPTVVLGEGSPLWDKFRSLASAPVMPVFGDGKNRIQPVHVDDVATCVAGLAVGGELGRRTIEFGGRDAETMGEFLRRVRLAVTGKRGPSVPVPVGPIIRLLALLEPALLRVLPATAGQFYVFAHDAVASGVAEAAPPPGERRGLEDLVQEGATATPPAAHEPTSDAELDEECRRFCLHLIGTVPDDYVRRKYREAHRPGAHGPVGPRPDSLTRIARSGGGPCRFADAWSAVLARDSTFRRKLVLLLAILESHGATSARTDSPGAGGAAAFFVATTGRTVMFALTFLVSLVAIPVLARTTRSESGAP